MAHLRVDASFDDPLALVDRIRVDRLLLLVLLAEEQALGFGLAAISHQIERRVFHFDELDVGDVGLFGRLTNRLFGGDRDRLPDRIVEERLEVSVALPPAMLAGRRAHVERTSSELRRDG